MRATRIRFPVEVIQQISLTPRAARPAQPSILPRSVNEYWIILGLTLGHRRWQLLPSTTTGGVTMTNSYIWHFLKKSYSGLQVLLLNSYEITARLYLWKALFFLQTRAFLQISRIHKEIGSRSKFSGQAATKYLEKSLRFSLVWSDGRLLSPETLCASCLTSCQTSWDLEKLSAGMV